MYREVKWFFDLTGKIITFDFSLQKEYVCFKVKISVCSIPGMGV